MPRCLERLWATYASELVSYVLPLLVCTRHAWELFIPMTQYCLLEYTVLLLICAGSSMLSTAAFVMLLSRLFRWSILRRVRTSALLTVLRLCAGSLVKCVNCLVILESVRPLFPLLFTLLYIIHMLPFV